MTLQTKRDKTGQISLGRPKDLAKRKKILDSAKTLFLKYGYMASSMNQIAAEAKVSKLTIYNHFHDKASLFTAAIEDTCLSLLHAQPLMPQHAADFLSCFHEFCQISLQMAYLPEAIKLEHLLFNLASENNPLAQQFYLASHGRMQRLWQDFFQHAIQLGCLKAVAVKELEECISSLLFGSRHRDVLLGLHAVPSITQKNHIVQHSMHIFLLHYAA